MTTNPIALAQQRSRGLGGLEPPKFKVKLGKKKKKDPHKKRAKALLANPRLRGFNRSPMFAALSKMLAPAQGASGTGPDTGVARPSGQGPMPTMRPPPTSSGVSVMPTAPVSHADMQRMDHERKQQAAREEALREEAREKRRQDYELKRDEQTHKQNLERDLQASLNRLEEIRLQKEQSIKEMKLSREEKEALLEQNNQLTREQMKDARKRHLEQLDFERTKLRETEDRAERSDKRASDERKAERESRDALERARLEKETEREKSRLQHEADIAAKQREQETEFKKLESEQAEKKLRADERGTFLQTGQGLVTGSGTTGQKAGLALLQTVLQDLPGEHTELMSAFRDSQTALNNLLNESVYDVNRQYDLTATRTTANSRLEEIRTNLRAAKKDASQETSSLLDSIEEGLDGIGAQVSNPNASDDSHEVANLQQQITELKNRIPDGLTDVKGSLSSLQAVVDDMRTDVRASRDAQEAASRDQAVLKASIPKLESEIEKLRDQHPEFREKIAQMAEGVNMLRSQVGDLERRTGALDQVTGITTHRTGEVEKKTEDLDRKTWNLHERQQATEQSQGMFNEQTMRGLRNLEGQASHLSDEVRRTGLGVEEVQGAAQQLGSKVMEHDSRLQDHEQNFSQVADIINRGGLHLSRTQGLLQDAGELYGAASESRRNQHLRTLQQHLPLLESVNNTLGSIDHERAQEHRREIVPYMTRVFDNIDQIPDPVVDNTAEELRLYHDNLPYLQSDNPSVREAADAVVSAIYNKAKQYNDDPNINSDEYMQIQPQNREVLEE